MKVYYHFKSHFILFKVDFGSAIGYSEYHELKKLGYPSFGEIVDIIRSRKRHFILSNAYFDAFEFSTKTIKENLSFQNHSLFYQNQLHKLSDTLKLKLTGRIEDDIVLVQKYQKEFSKLRLDCNNFYTKESFDHFIQNIETNKIEYIEDPFPFDFDLYQNYKVPLAIDHLYNLSKETDDYRGFPIIYRPTINPHDPRAYKSIFSNQFEGLLGSWHSYCYLLKLGDTRRIQGIYNPFVPKLYQISQNKIFIKKEVVTEEYKKLRELKWNRLKI